MELDVRTIYVMYAVLYLMLHGIIWFSLSRYQSRLVTQWSAAGMVSATGLALLGCQGVLPEWLVACLGQLLMAAGNFARQYVLRSTDGPAGRGWIAWNGSLHLVYLSLSGWQFFSGASHKTMMLVFFVFYALICVDFIFSGQAIGQQRRTLGAVTIQRGGLVFSVSLGVKALTLLAGWGAQDLYEPGWDQVVLFAAQILAISLLNFGFMQMLVDEFQQERDHVEMALVQQRQQATLAQLKSLDLATLLREREEIIRQLTLSNKTAGMGALVASIAHELNQPLTTIVIKTELIEAHLKNGSSIEEAQRLTTLIRDDTLQAATIIRTLRSMFAAGKGEFERLDFPELTRRVLGVVRARAEASGIALDVELDEHLTVEGEATQLNLVVLNLLNNAVEALVDAQTPHPRIGITCMAHDGFVNLCVRDNGPGIDPAQGEDIFALFKTSKSQGMGVGLWLSQAIVQSHRGHLDFQSSLGQGAVFSLRLPLYEHALID